MPDRSEDLEEGNYCAVYKGEESARLKQIVSYRLCSVRLKARSFG